jgi:hypothetical protein
MPITLPSKEDHFSFCLFIECAKLQHDHRVFKGLLRGRAEERARSVLMKLKWVDRVFPATKANEENEKK